MSGQFTSNETNWVQIINTFCACAKTLEKLKMAVVSNASLYVLLNVIVTACVNNCDLKGEFKVLSSLLLFSYIVSRKTIHNTQGTWTIYPMFSLQTDIGRIYKYYSRVYSWFELDLFLKKWIVHTKFEHPSHTSVSCRH